MSIANEVFVQASYVSRIAEQHHRNVDYWIIVLSMLLEEKDVHHNKRWFRKEHRKIKKLIRRNSLRALRLEQEHAKLMIKFHKFNRQEGWE